MPRVIAVLPWVLTGRLTCVCGCCCRRITRLVTRLLSVYFVAWERRQPPIISLMICARRRQNTRRANRSTSLLQQQVQPRNIPGQLASLRPKFSVTCFNVGNLRNLEPGFATDKEVVTLKRICRNQSSWIPERSQSNRVQFFLFHSRIPSPSAHNGSGKPGNCSTNTGAAHESILGIPRHVVSSAPSNTSAWSPVGATAACMNAKVCGDWQSENYIDVLLRSLKQIADSIREGVSPMPRLKIKARVAKCFFKHFVAPGEGGKRFSSGIDGAAPLTSHWSSSFSIPQLEEQLSNCRVIHQASTETTTMDNIARAQAYLQQAGGFEKLLAAQQSECKIIVHFLDTFSKDETRMAVTIRYSADDPEMSRRSEEQQRHGISELTDGFEETITASDPAIMEWVKQAWDSRSAGSLVFPTSARFTILFVSYKDIMHRYCSKNLKVSLSKVRQARGEDELACYGKVKNFWEASLSCLQTEKNMVAEAENLVKIQHMVYELVEEATKLTEAMGDVYIPY